MIRSLVLILIVLAALSASAQKNIFSIEGKLNTQRSSKIFLYISDIVSGVNSVDSVVAYKGNFAFKGTCPVPVKAILFSTPDNNRLDFFIESGLIKIESKDSLNNAFVVGGRFNRDFIELKKKTDPIDQKRRDATKKMKAILAASKNKESNELVENNFQSKLDSFAIEMTNAYTRFTIENPNNVASIYAIANIAGPNPDLTVIRPLFNNLTFQVRTSQLGEIYEKRLRSLERVKVGEMAPVFTQSDTAGHAISITDFKGKYVLLDFWASWCGPCREENPNLIKVFQKYKNSNFTILGISLDQKKSRNAWLEAISKDGLLWTQLSDLKGWNNEVGKLYNVESVPRNFLIDPFGRIIGTDLRGEKLIEVLSKVISTRN